MPLLNKETAENYKKRAFEEMQYFGYAFKICCMVIFWFRSAEINVANGFLEKKNFCLRKIAAWLPFRKISTLA